MNLPSAVLCHHSRINSSALLVHLVTTPLVLDVLRGTLLVGIILIILSILLIIELLRLPLRLVLCLLTVDIVHALGLGELVDLRASKAREKLLGELMTDWLACCYISGLV